MPVRCGRGWWVAYNMTLSHEQALQIRAWREQGYTYRSIARAAVEVGWPVTLDQTDGYDLCLDAERILGAKFREADDGASLPIPAPEV